MDQYDTRLARRHVSLFAQAEKKTGGEGGWGEKTTGQTEDLLIINLVRGFFSIVSQPTNKDLSVFVVCDYDIAFVLDTCMSYNKADSILIERSDVSAVQY